MEDFMKKLFTALITTLLIITSFQPIYADNEFENLYEEVNADGSISTYYDAYGNRLRVSDVKEMFNTQYIQNISTYGAVYPFTNTVLVNSYSLGWGTMSKMTPDVRGPATITYGTSLTTTSSISVNFGAEINAFVFKTLALKFGVSYTQSSSTSRNFSSTFNVPSGKTGAVYFTPRLYTGTCIYVDQNGQGTSTFVTFPKTINGFTDGVYELRTY